MKRMIKQLFACALALSVALVAVPMSAEAAPSVASSQTLYRTIKSGTSYTSVYVSGLSKSSTIKSVKSSNTGVMKEDSISYDRYTSSYTQTYFDKNIKDHSSSYSSYSANINFQVKKAGTSNITFKIGNKSYKTKVTIKNYVNPAKSFTVTGLKKGSSTNLASYWNTQTYASTTLKKNLSKPTIKVQAKTGWKLRDLEVENRTSGHTYRHGNYSKGMSSSSIKCDTIKKGKGAYIRASFFNAKDGGTLYCYYELR